MLILGKTADFLETFHGNFFILRLFARRLLRGSRITHMVFDRNLLFKNDSERQTFEKLSIAVSFTLRVFARNLMGGSRLRNIFIFTFWCLTWSSNPAITSNKPIQYLLDYDYFMIVHICSMVVRLLVGKYWISKRGDYCLKLNSRFRKNYNVIALFLLLFTFTLFLSLCFLIFLVCDFCDFHFI